MSDEIRVKEGTNVEETKKLTPLEMITQEIDFPAEPHIKIILEDSK